jgi:hypothetical protein
MRYAIVAQSFGRATRAPNANARVEEIDTNTNVLFAGCDLMNVRKNYEAFWNNVNPNSPEVVFVQSITPLGE